MYLFCTYYIQCYCFLFKNAKILIAYTTVQYHTVCQVGVLVAQLDKALDYESRDSGFKSLQGYFCFDQGSSKIYKNDDKMYAA